MKILKIFMLLTAFTASVASPALAQRLPFERVFDVPAGATLDVSTIRGKIAVHVGDPGRIVVAGMVTIHPGWDVPANAAELARRVADHPPIEQQGNALRLHDPSDAAERRAVTVSYDVHVPPTTRVSTVSDSGATTVRGIVGDVSVRTKSAAIDLGQLGGATQVVTGSGSVRVDEVAGALSVTTSSSGFTGRSLAGNVRVRTNSGAVDASLSGAGDVDVETGSSAIRLRGARGAVKAVTRSGGVAIQGAPSDVWETSAGSGSVRLDIEHGTGFMVNAVSGSSSVKLDGVPFQGSIDKGTAIGTVGGGGPLVRVTTRSGSICLKVGE